MTFFISCLFITLSLIIGYRWGFAYGVAIKVLDFKLREIVDKEEEKK